MAGGVTNLGTQFYTISGGQVVYGYVGPVAIDSGASLQYNLVATQSGVTTKGFGYIHLSENVGGVPVSLKGTFQIGGADMGAGLPAGCGMPPSYSPCSQILPFDFIGSSNIQVTIGTNTQSQTLIVESPYWNPFGGPIYLVSADGNPLSLPPTPPSIVIVATYNEGNIEWVGAQTGGYISGTLGTSSFSGTFSQTSTENENLVTGIASDSGTIQFSTTLAALNTRGTFTGSDTIPPLGSAPLFGAWDCSGPQATGGDGIPGTCALTGFISSGNFRAGGVSGSYLTTWGAPAYQFSSIVSGSLNHNGNSHQQGWFSQLQSWFGRF